MYRNNYSICHCLLFLGYLKLIAHKDDHKMDCTVLGTHLLSLERYWLYGMNLQEKWETTESLKRMASFIWIQTSCFWTWEVWWNTTALTSYPVMTAWCSGVLMVTLSQGDMTAMVHWDPTAPEDWTPGAVGRPVVCTHKLSLFPPFILTWIVI